MTNHAEAPTPAPSLAGAEGDEWTRLRGRLYAATTGTAAALDAARALLAATEPPPEPATGQGEPS